MNLVLCSAGRVNELELDNLERGTGNHFVLAYGSDDISLSFR